MINQVNSPIIGIKAPIIGASKIKKKMIHFLLSNCINELELDVDDEEKKFLAPFKKLSMLKMRIAKNTSTKDRAAAEILLYAPLYIFIIAQVNVWYLSNATAPKSLRV